MARETADKVKIARGKSVERGDKLKKGLKPKDEDIGPYKEPKKHRKKESERKYSPKANKKIHKVIREFEEDKLHSGSKTGPKVKNLRQAVAIGINEAKRKGYKVPQRKK
jgi:hypothetical protein